LQVIEFLMVYVVLPKSCCQTSAGFLQLNFACRQQGAMDERRLQALGVSARIFKIGPWVRRRPRERTKKRLCAHPAKLQETFGEFGRLKTPILHGGFTRRERTEK
jgi:hypothetical protein